MKREDTVWKLRIFKDLGLIPEALAHARALTEHWPDHPSGWSYLTELYGDYLGLGKDAAEVAKRAFACSNLEKTEYWNFLCYRSWVYSATVEDFTEALRRLARAFPDHSSLRQFPDKDQVLKKGATEEILLNAQLSWAKGSWEDNSPGMEASHLELALPLIPDDDRKSKIRILTSLQNALRGCDMEQEQARRRFGFDFHPEDRLSLRRRLEILNTLIEDYSFEDVEIANWRLATLLDLEEYDRVLAIWRSDENLRTYDKAMGNAARALISKAYENHARGRFEPAIQEYRQAQEILQEAHGKAKEVSTRNIIDISLREINQALAIAARRTIPLYHSDFQSYQQGNAHAQLVEAERKTLPARELISGQLTPQGAARAARERLDLSKREQVQQLVMEVLEDMPLGFAAAILLEFRSEGFVYGWLTEELARIALSESTHEGIRREAGILFSMLINARDVNQTTFDGFAVMCQSIGSESPGQPPEERLGRWVDRTYGSNIAAALVSDFIRRKMAGQLPSRDYQWWKANR